MHERIGRISRERERKRRKTMGTWISPADSEQVVHATVRKGNQVTWQNVDLKA